MPESLNPKQKQRALEIARTQGLTCSACDTDDLVVASVFKPWGGERYMVNMRCENKCMAFVTLPLVVENGELVPAPVEELE